MAGQTGLGTGVRIAVLVCAALLAAAGTVTGRAAAPSIDEEVRAVAARLRCPVCRNESVADSPSELAAQMRAIIRTRLEEGEPPEAIVAYFVSRYGEWILLDPPRRGLGWLLWAAPLIVLLLGLAAAGTFLRRVVRPENPAS